MYVLLLLAGMIMVSYSYVTERLLSEFCELHINPALTSISFAYNELHDGRAVLGCVLVVSLCSE